MRCRGDGGLSTPVFVAMLAVLVLGLGGVSADLWRVIAAHRELTGHVDAAAAAGATAIDEERLYADPLDHRLDPVEATKRTCLRLSRSDTLQLGACPGPHVQLDIMETRVALTVEREVDLELLGLLTPGVDQSVTVRITAVVALLRGASRPPS